MKIYYRDEKIWAVVYEVDVFKTKVDSGHSVKEVDEIDPTNKQLCIDLASYGNQGRKDINGNARFYIDVDGDIDDRSADPGGWEEYIKIDLEYQ